VKPPSPLPQDLQQFISGAGDNGIILFSLGTLGDAVMTKDQVDMLAEIFGRLEQGIIWRLNGKLRYKVLTHLGREIRSIITVSVRSHNAKSCMLNLACAFAEIVLGHYQWVCHKARY